MTFRVQPAVITRICDGCRTESDPVDRPVLLDQGWTLAPGTPYDHPVTALDWCPNCTTIRSDLAVAIARVRKVCECIQTDTYDLRPDSREALRAHERLAVAHMILLALDGGAE